MRQDAIVKIGVDGDGSLYLQPMASTFPYIWRAGMEVNWDAGRSCLFSPKPRQWTYTQWFQQLTKAVQQEYGVTLTLTPATEWENVPLNLRKEIEAVAADDSLPS